MTSVAIKAKIKVTIRHITYTARIALAKFEAFARDVRARGYEDITVRIRKLYLPVFDALPPAFGNLLHGPLSEEMGKVAREILGKEEAL